MGQRVDLTLSSDRFRLLRQRGHQAEARATVWRVDGDHANAFTALKKVE